MSDPRNLSDRSAMAGSMVGRIPEHTHAALVRYIERGDRLGHFCTALLSNDLKGAVLRADDENIRALPLLVSWLYNNAPSLCWGSPERVDAWIAQRGMEAYQPTSGEAGVPS